MHRFMRPVPGKQRLIVLQVAELGAAPLLVERLPRHHSPNITAACTRTTSCSSCTSRAAAARFTSARTAPSSAAVTQLIVEQRLERARRWLAETDELIDVIAERCGFTDPGYFTRVFRSRFGVSPRAWRQAHGHPLVIAASR